jgi:hypothetical protein
MSQSDFASLAIQTELVNESFNTNESEAISIAYGNLHASQTDEKSNDTKTSDVCIPVNFIPDEVLAFIADWESTKSTSLCPCDRMALIPVIPVSQNGFEPVRRLADIASPIAPPKLFYRTFWRSVTRRIVALSSTPSAQKLS